MVHKVALLTAGGFAPCLSTAIGGLIQRYTAVAPEIEIIAYKHGYQGLLSGDLLEVTPAVREKAHLLELFGQCGVRSGVDGSSRRRSAARLRARPQSNAAGRRRHRDHRCARRSAGAQFSSGLSASTSSPTNIDVPASPFTSKGSGLLGVKS